MIAKLSDPVDTAKDGRFEQDNRDTLGQMRQSDRDRSNTGSATANGELCERSNE
jgi:hypothetical protein